jgi:hypothetical protein
LQRLARVEGVAHRLADEDQERQHEVVYLLVFF